MPGNGQLLDASLAKLESWIDHNGWAGYDPYDLRETSFVRQLDRSGWGRSVRRGMETLAPELSRRLMRIRPQINAKAVALLALAYLARLESTGQDRYQQKAVACLNWLEENRRPGYAGACWGYPFDWYTRIKIPAGTPSAVVSAIGGWAFLQAYHRFRERRYLDMAQSTAEFFLNDLNVDRLDGQRTCFSYTPLDRFHVHNANLFVAAHLYQVGALINNPAYTAAAESAAVYTLGEQNEDGSFYYWGPPDEMRYIIDHYHTGFVLRCLDRIQETSRQPRHAAALERGVEFYTKRLFEPSGLPRMTPDRAYPVDIHSCAEAILCLTQLSERFDTMALLSKTTEWTLDGMQAADGHFYYRKYPLHTVRIAYFRWGQAWMLWALASLSNADRRTNP